MSGRLPSLLRFDLRRAMSTLAKSAVVAERPFCQLLLVMSVIVASRVPFVPREIVFLIVSDAAMLVVPKLMLLPLLWAAQFRIVTLPRLLLWSKPSWTLPAEMQRAYVAL